MHKKIFINATNHIAGRLASKIAKHLLEGHSVTVFFAESITYAFPIERAKKIYESYLHKRCVVNPNKGPYHYVEPSKYFMRMVKRMLKHKTKKGADALKRLTVHESIPREFYAEELQVVPCALRKIKSDPKMKFCYFGELLRDFGWKHFNAVKEDVKKYQEFKAVRNEEEKENLGEISKVRNEDWFGKKVAEMMKSYE